MSKNFGKLNEELTRLVGQGEEQQCLTMINNLSDTEKPKILIERPFSEADGSEGRCEAMVNEENLIGLAIKNNMSDLANLLITIYEPTISLIFRGGIYNPNVRLLELAAAKGMHDLCIKIISLLSDEAISSYNTKNFGSLKHAIDNKWEDICLLLIPKVSKECLIAMHEDQNHNLVNMAFNNHMKDTYYALENLMRQHGLNAHDELLGILSINEDYW